LNRCAIARANEGNPSWSQAHAKACFARWLDDARGRAEEIAVIPSLEARRKALEKFKEPQRSRIKLAMVALWGGRSRT